jgi:tRNA(fMet)-specific endonuclease VapC
VLDTDTCVEILRGNQRVLARRVAIPGSVVTTWITAGELFHGAARSAYPASNHRLVTDFLTTLTVLDLDLVAAQRFGALKAELEGAGRRLADLDLLIAATTLAHGAILVTGNRRHYGRIPGLHCEDWIRPGAAG